MVMILIGEFYDSNFNSLEVSYFCDACGSEAQSCNDDTTPWKYEKVPEELVNKYKILEMLK